MFIHFDFIFFFVIVKDLAVDIFIDLDSVLTYNSHYRAILQSDAIGFFIQAR